MMSGMGKTAVHSEALGCIISSLRVRVETRVFGMELLGHGDLERS
jgi:hypothetical protein